MSDLAGLGQPYTTDHRAVSDIRGELEQRKERRDKAKEAYWQAAKQHGEDSHAARVHAQNVTEHQAMVDAFTYAITEIESGARAVAEGYGQ